MDHSHASLCMGFARQVYWSGLPFPSSGDLSDPGIKPVSPTKPIFIYIYLCILVTKKVKNLPANEGETGSIPDPGRSHMLWSN